MTTWAWVGRWLRYQGALVAKVQPKLGEWEWGSCWMPGGCMSGVELTEAAAKRACEHALARRLRRGVH